MIQWFKWLRVKIVMLFVKQEPLAEEEDTAYRPENEWPMR